MGVGCSVNIGVGVGVGMGCGAGAFLVCRSYKYTKMRMPTNRIRIGLELLSSFMRAADHLIEQYVSSQFADLIFQRLNLPFLGIEGIFFPPLVQTATLYLCDFRPDFFDLSAQGRDAFRGVGRRVLVFEWPLDSPHAVAEGLGNGRRRGIGGGISGVGWCQAIQRVAAGISLEVVVREHRKDDADQKNQERPLHMGCC